MNQINMNIKILDNTMVGIESLKSLEYLSNLVKPLNGYIAEVGVYRGGSALLLCQLNPENDVYLFDTFEGLPETYCFDNFHKKGDFDDVSERKVRDMLTRYENCIIHKGVFPSDTGSHVKDKEFKFVHLDVDTYKSYMDCLNFFYFRIIKNGIIIMDDYNSKYCLGAKVAIDNFMKELPEELIIGPERQAHFIKL